ncbi:MAG: hypothetical protein HRU20_11955 [Pseudomonadales bacterium]|nr:hypothetical protein [Pseudomonadales bacterium]
MIFKGEQQQGFARIVYQASMFIGGGRSMTVCLLLLLGMLANMPSRASETLVLAPQLKQGFYQTIFNEMIQGIRDAATGSVNTVMISRASPRLHAEPWLEQYQPDYIISLGSLAGQTYKGIDVATPWVLGAVHKAPKPPQRSDSADHGVVNNASNKFSPNLTVSLIPAPDKLFDQLHALAPKINRIHVVYQQADDALITYARMAAKQLDITLHVYQAEDLKHSAELHQDILKNAKPEHDALWLLQNPAIVDNRLILPRVLKVAWQRKLTIISNKLSHVKHGVLLSLYPDNYQLGQYLWQRAAGLKADNIQTGSQLEWLKQTRLAVNTRTARHLGLRFSAEQNRQIDLKFPRH